MNDCIFCKMGRGEIGELIWENDVAVAFYDIHPKAKVHALVIPRAHIKNIDHLDDVELAGKLVMAVRQVIKQLGLVEANKVLVQGIELDHLHFHVMSDSRYRPAKVA